MDVRAQFPALKDTRLVYLDSAATSQKPQRVIDAVARQYEQGTANVHRGLHHLAEQTTTAYEEARATIAAFINASPDDMAFTPSTTYGINALAQALFATHNWKTGDIITTVMEHHSNFVVWQQLAKRHGLGFKVIPITQDGTLDMGEAQRILQENKPLLLAVTHVSNVLGVINPIKELADLAHEHGAFIIVDGAQAVAHLPVDVKKLDVDFYVFSSHKMYGPDGVGALYGRHLDKLQPGMYGGEMVERATLTEASWADAPLRFEPGTPSIANAIGFAEAARFIQEIGFPGIQEHERELVTYALQELQQIEGLTIYGPKKDRATAIAFTMEGVHPHDLAQVLDSFPEGSVAVRSGHHCTGPLHEALNVQATTRASISVSTTKRDIDILVKALHHAKEVFA